MKDFKAGKEAHPSSWYVVVGSFKEGLAWGRDHSARSDKHQGWQKWESKERTVLKSYFKNYSFVCLYVYLRL